MSNLLYLDESNGNGVYAVKPHNNSNSAAIDNNTSTAAVVNNLTSIMATTATTTNASGTTAVATDKSNANANGNTALLTTAQIHSSVSNEDLSQSLSEYTDADESISAPTEFLAEFLSAVMLKDYKKALKYCKLILQYEPNNATAKEFYPLILEKLRGTTSSDSDENYNKSSSSPEILLDMQGSDPSAGESDGGVSDDQLQASMDEHADDFGVPEDNSSREPNSNDSHMASDRSSSQSSSCGSPGISLSEFVDGVDDDDDDDDEDDDVDHDMSSSGDDLPNDEQLCGSGSDDAADDVGGAAGDIRDVAAAFVRGIGKDNDSRNSSSGGENRSRSDNTTHSYSSLLLEEEDDIVPASLQFQKELANDLDVSNGNKIPSASCSDSESPTEPLTQRLAAILRSKCSISTGD